MNKFRVFMLLVTVIAIIAMTPYFGVAEKTVLQAFDRQACYASCGCDSLRMVSACFDCKQECDRKYWAEFDKEMGENKKGSNDDND
jgi:hypothetical protein